MGKTKNTAACEAKNALRTIVQMSGNIGQIEKFINTKARDIIAQAPNGHKNERT
jgi:hypothetical protein